MPLIKFTRIYCAFFLLIASVRPTVAQVVLDHTLSNGGALTGPNYNISAELGKTVGVNLFHSFQEFNLQTGESAAFTGPDRIQNILGRVTGVNESYIDGLIESKIPGANLYLLNPNGFIFDGNSQVSVEGSFTVSTHEGIRIGEGQFNAVDPDKSVLVVSDAKSFGFLGDNPLGDIVLNGGFLSVSGAKQSIALAANQVTFQDEAYVGSENGGNVDIQASGLSVLSASGIAVFGSEDHQGGQINISAGTVVLDEGGGIYAGSGYDPEQPRGPNGGSINITADSLSVKAGNIDASSEGLGRAGDINILSKKIEVGAMEYEEGEREASISADAVFVGTIQEQELIHSGKWTIDGGGNIKIDSETVDIVNGGVVSSISIGQGDAGSVTLNTGNLKLADWAAIGTFTQFRPTGDQDRHIKGGHGGNLTIDANDIVFSYVSLELGTWGSGDSGTAIINADSLFMELTEVYGDSYGLGYETVRPGQEDTFVVPNESWFFATGEGPNLTLNVKDITLSESSIDLRSTGAGNAGSLTIHGQHLKLDNESSISSLSAMTGNAGSINIVTDRLDVLGQSKFETSTEYRATTLEELDLVGGAGGDLSIDAKELYLINGSLDVGTKGSGQSGTANIKSDSLLMIGGKINADASGEGYATENRPTGGWDAFDVSGEGTWQFATGDGPLVEINIGRIELSEESRIDVKATGAGDAGMLSIEADFLELTGGSKISSKATKTGDGGAVFIDAEKVLLTDGSEIETLTEYVMPPEQEQEGILAGRGGALFLNAKELTISDGSGMELGTSGTGDSGPAMISSDKVILTGESYINGDVKPIDLSGEDDFDEDEGDWQSVTGNGPDIVFESKEMAINGGSKIDITSAGAGNAGSLSITTKNLEIADFSSISSTASKTGNAGSIEISADDILLNNYSEIATVTNFIPDKEEQVGNPAGTGGDLVLEAKTLKIMDNSGMELGTWGQGDSGSVTIRSDEVILEGSYINGDVYGDAALDENFEENWQSVTGVGPLISFESKNISLAEGSDIDLKTTGAGDAGMLSIEADFLELTGESNISSKATKTGDGGAVFIDAEKVLLTDGSEIETLTEYVMPPEQEQEGISAGRGGALFLNAKELTISDGSGMELGTSGTGDSGLAMITSDKVILTGWSYINGDVKPSVVRDFEDEWRLVTGNGPDIVFETKEIIINEWSNIDIKTEAAGNAGFLSIETDSLELRGISNISSSSSKTGNGGYIVIDTDDLLIEGLSQIETATMYRASSSEEAVFMGGQGGNLTISAKNINMKMGKMELGTWGSGESGTADISAKELNLNNGSIIFGDAYGWGDDWQYATGKGPDINLEIESIYLDGESSIDMKSTGAGNAGNLMITSLSLTVDNDSRISSKSSMTGNAGSITINTDSVKLIQGGAIETFTEFRATSDEELNLKGGRGGDLLVDANEIILQQGRMEIGTWGSGDSGYANFAAEKLTLGDGSVISGNAYGLGYITEDRAGVELIGPDTWMYATGNGPELFLNVDGVRLNGSSSIDMKSTGAGNAGSLTIKSAMLAIGDHSIISSKASMTGDAGKIVIDTEELSLTGYGKIETYTEYRPVITEETSITAGNGGDLVVNAHEIVLDHGKMELGTWGNGAGGSATIKADTLTLRDSSINADAMGESYLTADRGHLGAVEDMALDTDNSELIETNNNLHFAISGEGFFEVLSPWGDGQKGYTRAGKFKTDNRGNLVTNQGFELNIGIGQIPSEGELDIALDGKYSIYKSNGEVSSTGQIQITRFSNPSALEGVGMDIYVESEDSGTPEYGVPSMDGFGELSQGLLEVIIEKFNKSHEVSGDTWSNAKGRGGELLIDVNNLYVLDRSRLNLRSSSAGDVGSLSVQSAETIVTGDSLISTESKHANGGAIRIQSLDALKVDSSKITAQAKEDGGSVTFANTGSMFLRDSFVSAEAGQDGGNIFVEAPETLVLQRSRLTANAIYGNGGYILITADGFLPSIETSITASSEFGVQGTVEIRTPDTDVGSGLVVLPETLVSRNINLAERCALRLAGDLSSFFINGQGGVPVWASHNYMPTVLTPEPLDGNKSTERGKRR